jgi:NADPH2:quinone reductase
MAEQSANRSLTSKAVTYKSLGGYEVIEFVERTVRAPAAGEVRIEVKAAAVNPTDLMFRDPGFANLTSNIVPGMMPQESSSQSGQAYRAYIPARR